MINEYVSNICYYLIITTVLFNIFPDEKYIKYIKLFSGLLLIMIIINPFIKLFDKDIDFGKYVNEMTINTDKEELEKNISEYEQIVEDRIREYDE